ncbi:MAG: YifB family Mg chelatase-like AAA ATPase [Candidatus Peribacter sp.]|nr:YifB family Mg chelatase-like AAA ATPase [Candidatus Peribacter sp.]
MLTKLTSFATIGLESERITVEVGSAPGEGKIFIVGLGDMSVQESKQRVRHALRAQGYHFATGLTITVNLAPANLRKAGPRYDLAIALGVLIVNGSIELPENVLESTAFLGELALDGSLRHITGILPAAIACRKMGITRLVVPAVNGSEAALIPGVEVIAAEHISEVIAILKGEASAAPVSVPASSAGSGDPEMVDFADIRGQEHAKRALEIAAAGGHNVLMSGAPGAGKTLLARAFRGILPPLSQEESIEVTRIYSVANLLPPEVPLITSRPFRVVHHTASGVSIVGGGQTPGPGEISLAHRGVLFLDELAEFPAQVLEVLRQPLEDRRITITRAQGSVTFPADFTMIAAMNPPRFTAGSKEHVHRRISAPLLDRIDLTVNVQPVPIADLQRPAKTNGDTTAAVLARVLKARKRQASRFALHTIRTNKEMGVKEIDALCPLKADAQSLLSQAVDRMGLSARGYHRAIKVARTIADLADAEHIGIEHVAEALQYRQNIDE